MQPIYERIDDMRLLTDTALLIAIVIGLGVVVAVLALLRWLERRDRYRGYRERIKVLAAGLDRPGPQRPPPVRPAPPDGGAEGRTLIEIRGRPSGISLIVPAAEAIAIEKALRAKLRQELHGLTVPTYRTILEATIGGRYADVAAYALRVLADEAILEAKPETDREVRPAKPLTPDS